MKHKGWESALRYMLIIVEMAKKHGMNRVIHKWYVFSWIWELDTTYIIAPNLISLKVWHDHGHYNLRPADAFCWMVMKVCRVMNSQLSSTNLAATFHESISFGRANTSALHQPWAFMLKGKVSSDFVYWPPKKLTWQWKITFFHRIWDTSLKGCVSIVMLVFGWVGNWKLRNQKRYVS